MESATVFYSWQSDTASNINRNFIEKALKAALKAIATEAELTARPELDKDTQGVTGSPAVAETIFAKIDGCTAFVADLTLVGEVRKGLRGMEEREKSRLFPNPSVLIEYGYALHAKTYAGVVAVMNTAFGEPKELPFDIAHKRWPIRYELSDAGDPEKPQKLEQLTKELQTALKGILIEAQTKISEAQRQRRRENEKLAKARLTEMMNRLETEDPARAKHPHMLLGAVAEEVLVNEEDWSHEQALALVKNLRWGKVDQWGREEVNTNWAETSGKYGARPDEPKSIVRVWDNWTITAQGEFWMYQGHRPRLAADNNCFGANTWEDETISFIRELTQQMRQKWPKSRIFYHLRSRGLIGHTVLYDQQPLWTQMIAGQGNGKINKELDSPIVIAEPNGGLPVERVITTVWLSMGIRESPRHKQLFGTGQAT